MDKIVIYDTETTNSTIWGSIIEVGNKLNVDTSTLKLKNNELKLKAENLGLYNRSDSIDKITK